MAIRDGALRFQDSCEQAGERPHAAGLKSLVPKLLTVCIIFCSMSFAGCARNPAQREVSPALHEGKAPSIRGPVRTRRYSEPYRYVEPTAVKPPSTVNGGSCRSNRSGDASNVRRHASEQKYTSCDS
jgi:hypothetical protein